MPSKEALRAAVEICAGINRQEHKLIDRMAEIIDREFVELRRDLAERAERADGWEREAEKLQDLCRIAGELLLALQTAHHQCTLHNEEYHWRTSDEMLTEWNGLVERARAAGIGADRAG